MDYMEIWFWNITKQMRNLGIIALIGILFFIFSNVMIHFYLKSTYQDIKNYEVSVTSPTIAVTEAKGTYVNGYVKGKIGNNTPETIANKYIRIDFYTERDVNVGTEYVEINSLVSKEVRDFEVKFKLHDVSRFVITFVDKQE